MSEQPNLVAYKVRGMTREMTAIKSETERRKKHVQSFIGNIDDIIIPRKFNEEENTVYIGNPKIVVDGQEYKATNGALNQALYKLQIAPPFKFFLQKDPTGEMLDSVIKWGIKQQIDDDGNKEKFKMFLDDQQNKMYGIMSSGYVRIHDADLLSFVGEKMQDSFTTTVKSFTYLNDEKTVITMLSPSKEKKLAKVGDTLRFGVTVSNSEFGFGALVMQPFYEILRCSNGAVVKQVIEFARYIHRKVTIFEAFKDAVKDAFQMCEASFAMFERSVERKPIVDSIDELSDFMYHHGLPKRLHENILKAAQEEPLPLNGYGIFNHITRAATHYEPDPANQQALLMHAYNFLQI